MGAVADPDGTTELVERLKRALRKDGDFPVSAKIVKEVTSLTSDPKTTAAQLSEVILREPTLGMRVLHVVNSSFHRRAKPIMTVSQAVMQIGMKPLADLCANLVLLQRFVPTARQGGAFASCLRKTILTSLLSNFISTEASSTANSKGETGHLFGLFSEMGTLLLAFYFPQVYENAVRRAELKKVSLSQAVQEITGLTPMQLSIEVISALELPPFYGEVMKYADLVGTKASSTQSPPPDVAKAASTLFAARNLSNVIAAGKSKEDVDAALDKIKANTSLSPSDLADIIGRLPEYYKDYCASVELTLPPLPEFLQSYSATSCAEPQVAKKENVQSDEDSFANYLAEIRIAVDSREPTASIITSVMETLAWSLGFDRVLLMLMVPGRKQLVGRMLLGKGDGIDPTRITRPLGPDAGPYSPDANAFTEGRCVFTGDPVLPNGWPLAAIPVGFGKRALGIIYADKLGSNENELSARHQAAVGVLAELLDRSMLMQQG